MAESDQFKSGNANEEAQILVGFMSNDEWDALLARLNGLIQSLEELPGGEVKTTVFETLEGVDALHREALRRLFRLFKEGVLEKVVSDPAIHTLMELYDLLPAEVEEPEAQKPKSRFPTFAIKAVSAAPAARQRYPHWVPVLQRRDELPPGFAREFVVDDGPVLLCRREDAYFAVESACARDGSTLSAATLSGFTLTCPNHAGCYYDVRQGTRIGGGESIACYPVKQDEDGRVSVGLDMDFKPNLPSF